MTVDTELDFDHDIESHFKALMAAEDEISKRTTEVTRVKDEADSKVRLLESLIADQQSIVDEAKLSILTMMQHEGVTEHKVSGFTVKPKQGKQSVVIVDEKLISGNYITTTVPKVTKSPNKVLIGALLRKGEEIAGAKLSDVEYTLEIKAK